MGPPATEVTATGSGWPAGVNVEITVEGATGSARPYATVTAAPNGSFTARFRLEKTPSGDNLQVGPLQLIARAGEISAGAAFQVQTARPVPIPGGG